MKREELEKKLQETKFEITSSIEKAEAVLFMVKRFKTIELIKKELELLDEKQKEEKKDDDIQS